MVRFLVISLFLATKSFAERCPVISYENLLQTLEKKERAEIFFFATWCGDCLQHMKDAPGRVYIAAFDEQKNAEAVFHKLKLSAPCYTDDDSVKKLKINSVPAHFLWFNKKLKRIL